MERERNGGPIRPKLNAYKRYLIIINYRMQACKVGPIYQTIGRDVV